MGSGGQNKKESPEIKAEIVRRFSEGELLKNICVAVDISVAQLFEWRNKDTVFDQNVTSAQQSGFEVQADSLLTIYDEEEDTNKARGKSDNLKWVLARRAASKYGDKLQVDMNNTIDLRGALEDARQRKAQIAESVTSRIDQAIDITPKNIETPTDLESVAPSSELKKLLGESD